MADRAGRLVAALLAVCAGAVVVVVLAASPAAAHATLIGSTPADGVVLPSAPAEVQLTFSEPVQAVSGGVAVTGPDGDRVDGGVVRRPSATVVAVRLPGLRVRALGGTYTVTWRVISADSHPVGGAFTFSIGVASHAARVRTVHAGRALGITFGVARFAAFAGFAMLVGSAAMCCYAGSQVASARRVRRLLVAGWAVSVVAAVALLLLQGPYVAGRDLTGAVDTRLVTQTLHSRYGTALAVRLLLLGVLPALLVGAVGPLAAGRRRIPAFVCGTVIAAGLGATWAAASHAATGAHGGTALVADVAHLLAASVWVGGLATALTLLPFTEVAGTAVHRFSRLAMVCVGVLVVTGLFQAWLRVQTPAAVLTTTYGRLLAAKIAVLVTVLTVAYLARVRLRRADRSGLRLGRLLAAETAGVAVVLALTAVLVQSPPAAQAYAARPVTRSARFHSGRDAGLFTVRLPNAARGVDGGHVIIRSEDGRLRDVLEMKASWTQLRLGIGPLPVRFSRTGPGHYQASWPSLPVPGTWRLALTIRTTDIDETTVRTQLAIH